MNASSIVNIWNHFVPIRTDYFSFIHRLRGEKNLATMFRVAGLSAAGANGTSCTLILITTLAPFNGCP
jgi:hypothetical protein